MSTFHQKHPQWHRKLSVVVTALSFIVVGIMFLGRNLGWVDPEVFSVIVSWQMLLIVIGLVQILKRHLIGGLILITVGTYFLLPSKYGLGVYWPVLLIVIGFGILLKLRRRSDGSWSWEKRHKNLPEYTSSDEGYVVSDVSFGGAKHIVLDPVFKGANLDASFGSISLDLRRTTLDAEETYIDVDCSFSGIELYIPSHWNVVVNTDNSFGAVEDKRYHAPSIDYGHKLIIRGDVNFGGVEIKS